VKPEADVARILVLGPVEMSYDGGSVAFARQQERFILGVLALEVGRPIATDRLIDLVWDETVPRSARAVLQTRMSTLRSALHALPILDAPGGVDRITIESRRSGYVLIAPDDAVDAHVFLRHVRGWRTTAASQLTARDQLRAALALWRGPVLGEPGERHAELPLRHTLESARLTALEDLFELELELGNHALVADEILRLPAADRQRERLVESAMIALYRSGRAADALLTFDRWRRWLDDELGTVPGTRAQEIHRAILKQLDPAPITVSTVEPAAARSAESTVPRTLPPDVVTFAGREAELETLTAWLSGDARVVSITGPPGVGKTALSVRAAYNLVDQFPDGQLFADLRGADDRAPAEPKEILLRFLRAMGVAIAPGASLDDHVDAYRSALANRHVLVICDNVSRHDQMAPLIPPGPGNRLVVTGRNRRHSGEADRAMELRVLDERDATGLLRLLVGDDRVDAEPQASRDLVRLCGQLPIALRIVGARLRARPHWTIDKLADGLRGGHARLAQLADGRLDVRWSIGLSYDELTPEARLLLCAIADLEFTHLTTWAAAALLDAPVAEAEHVLDELFDAHLVDVVASDAIGACFQVHDLIRAYATEQAHTAEMALRLRQARVRLYGIYCHIADGAQKHVGFGSYLGRTDAVPRWIPDLNVGETLSSDSARWFEAERGHIIALIRRAQADSYFDACSVLVRLTSTLFDMRRYFDDWETCLEIGLAAATSAGDRSAAAVLRLMLTCAYVDNGHGVDAFGQAAIAAAEFRRLGDINGIVAAATIPVPAARAFGQSIESLPWVTNAMDDVEQATDPGVYAYAMRVWGQTHMEAGRYDEAAECLAKALATFRTIDSPIGLCQALVYQGRLLLKLGNLDRATAQFTEALDKVREIGDVPGVAQCLRFLAEADRARGDLDSARGRLLEALRLVHQPKPTAMERWVMDDLDKLDSLAAK
jgi:DNA-binding SARP family transcriptional activator/tetratricopeptide (TPR) repeat protein